MILWDCVNILFLIRFYPLVLISINGILTPSFLLRLSFGIPLWGWDFPSPLFIYLLISKNCERILPYLQANKIAHYYFLDTGRGTRLLGLSQRTLLFMAWQTAWASLDLHHILVSPKSHRDDTGGPRWIPAYTVCCAIGKEHWALGIHHFHSR